MVGLALGGAALGVVAEWGYHLADSSLADLLRDASVGWAFIAAGLVAWRRQPANRTGLLMVAEGFSWFLGNFQTSDVPVVFSLSYWLSALNIVLLGQLILVYPYGRLETRGARAVIGVGYFHVLVIGFVNMLAYNPRVDGAADYLCGRRCPSSGLYLAPIGGIYQVLDKLYYLGGVVLAVCVAVLIVYRWVRATRRQRRALAPVWVTTLVISLSAAYYAWITVAPSLPAQLAGAVLWASDLSQLIIPIAFLIGLLRMQLARGAVGELVIELERAAEPTRMRDALARTLGDPSLELAFWVPETEGYVTTEGVPVTLPTSSSERLVTLIELQGEHHAAIIHDHLTDDSRLVDAVRAAARLGLDNERLSAELRARMEELRASRVRIVKAADAERRRIERNLHDGAQQRLISVTIALGRALEQARDHPGAGQQEGMVRGAMEELRQALADIRELARGIHPAILAEQGLAGAITSLAEAAPLPVEVRIPRHRYPDLIEATAYYVAAEALSNALRHAHASWVEVAVVEAGEWLTLEVTDDGIGGADLRRGSGLQGLADRASTLGGRLEVDGRPGGGTRVRAWLPMAPAPQASAGSHLSGDGERC